MQGAVAGEWPSLFELLQRFGIGVLLLLILFTGVRRKWVWGWQYDDLQKDRDLWRAMALRQREKEPDE